MNKIILSILISFLIGGSAHAVVSNTVPQTIIACNGSATTFQYSFPIIDTTNATDLYVYTLTGTTQTLLTTNYSVNTPTATVTYPISGSPCLVGTSIVMTRVEPLTQGVSASYQGTGVTPPVMGMSDKLTMIAQQLQSNINNISITANSATSQVTRTIYVDANRVDSYTPTGSITFPFKPTAGINAIQNALTSIGTPGGDIAIYLAPGTYVENSLTFPNVPVTLYGQGSTVVTGLGGGNGTITFSNTSYLNNIIILGNLTSTYVSSTSASYFNNSNILGNFTAYGEYVGTGDTFLGTGSVNGLVTIEPGALFNLSVSQIGLPVTGYYSRILNEGTLVFDDGQVFTNDNSNYALDSSTSGSQIDISLVRFYNYGVGANCGITVAGNGATTSSNSIGHVYVFCAGSTNGIVGGTSSFLTDMYQLVYSFNTSPSFGVATGTNITARNYGPINTTQIIGFPNVPLQLSSTGNIGLGTSFPQNFLQVNGNVGIGTSNQNGNLIVYNGNVGIGTINPGQILDVGGTLGRIRDIGIGTTVPELVCRKADGTFGSSHGSTFSGTCN